MKKILVLIMAVILAVTVLSFVACGDETPDTTDNKGETTTTINNGNSGNNTDSTPTPPTTNAPNTTLPGSTAKPLAPNMKDPASVYHVEQIKVKTNSKGQDADLGYLIVADAGQNPNERYADGNGFIMYGFDVSQWIEPTIDFVVRQQYAIYVTDDIEVVDYNDMHCLANFQDLVAQDPDKYPLNDQGAYDGGANQVTITLNPYDYNYYGTVYVYIVNSNPPTGWGGTISSFTINHYVPGEGAAITTIDNSPSGEHWKPTGATEEVIEVIASENDEDIDYIFDNTGAVNPDNRYFDDNKYIIYRIEVRKYYQPVISLNVAQNYKIEVSPDGKTWYEVYNYGTSDDYKEKYNADPSKFHASGDYLEGDNNTTLVIDPYAPGESIDPITGNLYIKISDCFPTAGWGGKIFSFTITHYGLYTEEEK